MAKNDRRRFGDRKDGRLLRSLPAYAKFMPYIMPSRNDALNLYEESMEVTEVDRRLRRLRVDGYKGIGILHFMIAAYIRVVSMLPGLNRYVAGRRIYASNDITVIMTVKRALTIDATETSIKVHFEPTDTIFDVYRKMNEKIDEIKATEENNNTEERARIQKLVGQEGVALTALRPVGLAELTEGRRNVQSDGEFIEKGAKIRVQRVSGTTVYVKRV